VAAIALGAMQVKARSRRAETVRFGPQTALLLFEERGFIGFMC